MESNVVESPILKLQFNNSSVFKNIIDSFYSISPIKDMNGSSIVKQICIKITPEKIYFYSDNHSSLISFISIPKKEFNFYHFFNKSDICFTLYLSSIKKFLKTANKNNSILLSIYNKNSSYKIEFIIIIDEEKERRKAIEFEIEEIQNINFFNDDKFDFLMEISSSDFTNNICKSYGQCKDFIKFNSFKNKLIMSVDETKTKKNWDSFLIKDVKFKEFKIKCSDIKSIYKFAIFDKNIKFYISNTTNHMLLKFNITSNNKLYKNKNQVVGECNIWVKTENLQ